jgi:voltage-gated potassium channel Kch
VVKQARRTIGQKVRYRFDNTISRGTLPVIGYLAALTLAIVLLAALVLTVTGTDVNGPHSNGFAEEFWQSMLRVLDTGTFAGDNGWLLRIVSLTVTLFGISIAAVLIGLIASGIEQRIDQLRRGRSLVIEADHTLILGFSPRIYTIVSELCIANENRSKPRIVVLAPRDKEEIEIDLASRVPSTLTTRVICRSGDPSSLGDLALANIGEARSIILLGSDEEDGGDADVVKAVLASLHSIGDRDVPIVAELTDAETASALREASGGRVHTVRAVDVIARITAQACRQSGLSAVCQDLLDFDGDEIYFADVPQDLVGKTFGDSLLAYDTSAVIGVRSADGTVAVNPPMDRELVATDHVIAVSEDDDTVIFSGIVEALPTDLKLPPPTPSDAEQLLIVGWNSLGPVILTELDQFVPHGSKVDVLVDPDLIPTNELPQLQYQRFAEVRFEGERGDLDELTEHVTTRQFDHVIILGYRSGLSPREADARTLLTLLLLRRALQHTNGERPFRIVTELLDSGDVELARATGADDFVVSDALSSYMLTQLSENPELEAVFQDLFDAEGSALGLKPASWYVPDDGRVPFSQIVAAARERSEIAIGYRLEQGADGQPQVMMNPPKSSTVTLGSRDRVVVIGPPGE